MEAFKSSDLKEHHAEVLVYAEVAPTILLDDGQPRAVIMSVAEYQRLKAAAREPVRKRRQIDTIDVKLRSREPQ